MKILKKENIKVNFDDEVWFEIRPFPFSSYKANLEIGEHLLEQFVYCVTNWGGLVDEKDRPLVCNEDTKKQLFDFYPDLRDFVFSEVNKLSGVLDENLKN